MSGEDSALIVKEFNSITPENDMKIGPIHPAENRYNFANADAIVAFAQRNNLRVRGHNLVWHFESQTPKWIFKDKDGNQASKELVLQRLKDHITTVVSRYKGKLYEREQAQTEKYKMCFELFKKYRNAITSVTFWNLSDRYSWLDNFPVRNRKDYPLLFDQNLKPKKAYLEVVKIVQ